MSQEQNHPPWPCVDCGATFVLLSAPMSAADMNPPVEEYYPEHRIHHRIRLDSTTKPTGPVDELALLPSHSSESAPVVAAAIATDRAKL